MAKGCILAFQVPSQSSLTRFPLQTLRGPSAHSWPDERLCLGWLCQPLPAAASVSWLLKDNFLFFAWFSADSITKWDMQTGTAVLCSVIYSVPYRKIVITPWLLTEQREHLPTSDGYRLEVTPKITPKDTEIAVRIQVMFWTFFFSRFIMNSKLDLLLWELMLRYANISNQTSPIFQCEWARFQAKMLSQQNHGKIHQFSTFPICQYSSPVKCQQLLEQGYNPIKRFCTCLTFSTRFRGLLLYSLLLATLNF